MKVKELIEILKEQPQDNKVVFADGEKVVKVVSIDKETVITDRK